MTDALTYYGLRPTEDPNRWQLPVERRLCSGLGALFGGAALGACIEVLERVTGRPVVWATAQYLSFARPPATLDIDVDEVQRGHQVSQARAVGRLAGDGTEIVTVNAALGSRPQMELHGQWAIPPDVPPPADCPTRRTMPRHEGTIIDSLEMRKANLRDWDELDGLPGDGRSAAWVRIPGLDLTQASLLAVFGDYVPMGIGQSFGQRVGGNSLDNTIRIARRHATDWVLADIRVHAVADGFGHGLVHLWSEDGVLLATASQSTIVRRHQDEDRGNDRHEDEGGDRP